MKLTLSPSHRPAAAALAACTTLLAAAPVSADGRDLGGRWLMVQKTTTIAQIPVIGEISASTSLVALHDLTHDGSRLRGKGTLCKLELDSGSSVVTTTLPQAFKRALPPPMLDATVRHDGERYVLSQARQTVVVGAKLEAPLTGSLPTTPDDPRVFDQDGDGKPGVTVVVSGLVNGEMYVAQRSWTVLMGTERPDQSFGGVVYFGNEQVVLDTTSSWLADPPKASPDPIRSWFRMVRVADDAGCGTARRMAAEWLQ